MVLTGAMVLVIIGLQTVCSMLDGYPGQHWMILSPPGRVKVRGTGRLGVNIYFNVVAGGLFNKRWQRRGYPRFTPLACRRRQYLPPLHASFSHLAPSGHALPFSTSFTLATIFQHRRERWWWLLIHQSVDL